MHRNELFEFIMLSATPEHSNALAPRDAGDFVQVLIAHHLSLLLPIFKIFKNANWQLADYEKVSLLIGSHTWLP